MDFRILGTIEVATTGWQAVLAGQRRKALLAALVLHNGTVLPVDRLVGMLWDGQRRPGAVATLHSHVHHLRHQLGPAAALLRSEPPGYVLRAEPDRIDAVRFERLAREGRSAMASASWPQAADRLAEALALWRGRALEDLGGVEFAEREAARLEEERLAVLEDRLAADLALGRHHDVVAELEALTAQHPLREGIAHLLVLALYRSGRQGEALRAFQRTRAALVDELGIEPGRALRTLEQAVLDQDPALDVPPHLAAHVGAATLAVPSAADAGPGPDTGPQATSAVRPGLHGVPTPLTSFVGRHAELAALRGLLADARLVSITGSGGAGKTRLACELAKALAEDGRDVWFVDLAVVDPGEAVPGAIAAALGVGDRDVSVEELCRSLASRSLVLVLDSCEHVVDAVAALSEHALTSCPQLTVVATTREELGVTGEVVWRIPSLSVPAASAAVAVAAEVLAAESAQLLVERCRAGTSTADLTAAELVAVAALCRRLDGLPLAIELAAGLATTMPLPEVARRLDGRFRLLELRRRGWDSRHRTLEATIRWSFERLSEDEQAVFLRLSVFVGSFTLEAAEAVAGSDERDVAARLRRLVQTSMVSLVGGGARAGRYRVQEALRQFAAASLGDVEERAARQRHALHLLAVVERAEPQLHGPDAARWLAVVEDDVDDLRAALQWSFEEGQVEVGLRLAAALGWAVARMGHLPEVRRWLERWLEGPDPRPPRLRLLATIALGTVALSLGDHRDAGRLGEAAVRIARDEGDERRLQAALLLGGAAAVHGADGARAGAQLEEAGALARRRGDRWGLAWTLTWLGISSRQAGDVGRAEERLLEALAGFRALGDRHGQALPLVNLALLSQREGALERAASECAQAVDIGRALGDVQVELYANAVLGRIELDRGALPRARQLLVGGLERLAGAPHAPTVAITLEGVAVLVETGGDDEGAAVLWGAATAIRERSGLPALAGDERERRLAAVRAHLGPARTSSALTRGAALDVPDAIAVATATASGAG